MLIGDRDRLAIELHPLAPTWERRHLPERTGWAQLSLWVNGANLCRNVLDESLIREGVNVPLGPMADWFVRSWTFIRFEERPDCFPPRASIFDTLRKWGNTHPPQQIDEDAWFDARERWWTRHFLAAGADGAQLPNVSLLRGGDRLFIEWTPAEFAGARAPGFLSGSGQESVRWDDGEEVLAEFVACVAEWFRAEGLGDAFSWTNLRDPLHDAEADFHERLRAFTGIDAGVLRTWTATETDADLRRNLGGIPEGSDDPGESVITQVLRDLPPTVPESVRREVWRLDERTREATRLAEELRATARDAAAAGAAPEESGQLAAREVRDRIGLNGRPVDDMDEQMQELGVEVVRSGVECLQERMLAGSRHGAGAVAVINRTPRTATQWGERFELARAMGHLLVDSYRGDALGAASTTFTQPWARRCSGAFAAEFLLPSEHLFERFGALDSAVGHNVFPSLLDEYGVGARTAAFQLWNQGLLSNHHIRDELIDDFSNVGR